MRRVIWALLVSVVLSGCSGFHAMSPDEMQIQKVVEVPNTPKDVLFDKSRMWYAAAFRSATAVIQYENKENGTIMGNGVVSDLIMMTPCDMRFSVATEVKDNKARITATGLSINLNHKGEQPVNRRMWDNFKDRIEEIMTGYEQYIKGQSINSKSDNW
jgi:hypothetical protein